jgi:hypothetical protein
MKDLLPTFGNTFHTSDRGREKGNSLCQARTRKSHQLENRRTTAVDKMQYIGYAITPTQWIYSTRLRHYQRMLFQDRMTPVDRLRR